MSRDFTDGKSTLVQVMVWCCQAYKPSSEPMLIQIYVAMLHHSLCHEVLRKMSNGPTARLQRFKHLTRISLAFILTGPHVNIYTYDTEFIKEI